MRYCVQLLRRWQIEYGLAILPVLAACAVVLLFTYHTTDQMGGQPAQTGWAKYLSLSGYIPEWLSKGLLSALMMGVAAYFAFMAARRCLPIASTATEIGISTTLVLTLMMRQCDLTSGVVAGVTATGTVVMIATAVGFATRRFKWNLPAEQSIFGPEESGKGLVLALQIGMTLFVVFVIVLAVSSDELSLADQPLLLAFVGVGMTSAAAVSAKHSFKNCMAIAGMVISLAGAFIQVFQAVDVTQIMIAAALLAFPPFTILTYRSHKKVRIVAVPVLASIIVAVLTTLATIIPAAFITRGCNVADKALVWMWPAVAIIVAVAALSALIITVAMLASNNRKPATAERIQDGNKCQGRW